MFHKPSIPVFLHDFLVLARLDLDLVRVLQLILFPQ